MALISDYLAAASSPDASADALAIINIGCYSKVTATLKRYSVTIETLICGCFFILDVLPCSLQKLASL